MQFQKTFELKFGSLLSLYIKNNMKDITLCNISRNQMRILDLLNKHFNICLGGSISLIAHGLLNRRPCDIDLIVSEETFEKIKNFIIDRGIRVRSYTYDRMHIRFDYAGETFCVFGHSENSWTWMLLEEQLIRVSDAMHAINAKKRYVEQLKDSTHVQDVASREKHKRDIELCEFKMNQNGNL